MCTPLDFLLSQMNGDSTTHDQPVLRFRKVSDLAHTPTRGSELAAGYDLYSSVDCVVKAGGRALVDTDIQVNIFNCIIVKSGSFTGRLLWEDRSKEWISSQTWN